MSDPSAGQPLRRAAKIGVAGFAAAGAIAGNAIFNASTDNQPSPTTIDGLLGDQGGFYGAAIDHLPATRNAAATIGPHDPDDVAGMERHSIDERADVAALVSRIDATGPQQTDQTAPYRWKVTLFGFDQPERDLYVAETVPLGMIGDGGHVRFKDLSLVRWLATRFPRRSAIILTPPTPQASK